MITKPINENLLHRLAGNTRSQANASNDAGRVEDGLNLDHMVLQLKRPPEQEQAMQEFIASQQEPSSPNYHRWLTAEEIGDNFGPSPDDIAAVTGWLQSRGFTVHSVHPTGMTIDFSGTAGQVRSAFHAEIHNLNVNGTAHIANMSDPMIPDALAAVVQGVVSLHDFMPHAYSKPHAAYTFTSGSSTDHAVVPADLATIYNMNTSFSNGTIGKGQTIAVVEDSDMYSAADWTTFRKTFGLSGYTTGSLTTVHPAGTGSNNCIDPGVNSDDIETELDAEWASAAAPGAAIQVATCANTRTTFGGLIAVLNLIKATSKPTIISMSYGECEAENGAAANAAYDSAFQAATAAGISVFVAAGDEGAASCDAGATGATHGVGVSGFAVSQYDLAAGGTDFSDTSSGTASTYWSKTNGATFGSATGYIPEIPWNDSCAGSVLSKYLGYTQYGTGSLCSSSTASTDGLLTVTGGSGGPSGCFSGSPSTTGVVGGSCKGYAKPSWQKVGDGVRDIPDVSLFASNGLWGHYYVFCYSDRRNGGSSCTGAPSTWAGAGGTSFSSPILAGIQALVNQQTNQNWNLPAKVYYGLATTNPGVFHSVTAGDNVVNCSGSVQCFGATTSSGGGGGRRGGGGGGGGQTANGALSTSSTTFSPAYAASNGYNFATGLGSIDVGALLAAWGH
ncbi:MAG TPA: protease pro-enzyme activation domain-containing protein [Bryobacteraceae bacterium]|jgi:subtilase family serine protease|nr:protease pro-enzyme activation domain-containing protein [Bryobacteraceae bacterium]